ncbi:L-seryl-tRNA(Sec) selenium transferase [Stieleria bergensis]|uniref:L-seryl-tRNA(Sec) selenium transferase n=1 Tax=Stieleria bergensis TaxID=2528025 RepID=A0A517SS10_9BACT|nr:L-seryl-tRNA(Sec) selenium transferase [Planctomycetes bacterium SV_7m_r]
MRFPPWAVRAIRQGVKDVAQKASDPETIKKVTDQATELLRELPESASRGIDSIVKAASPIAQGAVNLTQEAVNASSAKAWLSQFAWGEGLFTGDGPVFAQRMVNATGVLLSDQGCGVPIADQVLQIGDAVLQGDGLLTDLRRQIDGHLKQELGINQHSVAVAASLPAALAALSPLASAGIVMHRHHAIHLPTESHGTDDSVSGPALPESFLGCQVTCCGGADAFNVAELTVQANQLVAFVDDGSAALTASMLDQLAGENLIKVAICPIGTVRALPTDAPAVANQIPCVANLIDAGFDLVVLAGTVVAGMPACGVLVGKTRLVEQLQQTPCWSAMQASDAIASMVLAAVAAEEDHLWTVLAMTDVQNLRSRAERLAIRLTADPGIESCQITDQAARLSARGCWQFPSRQLRLRPAKGTAQAWADGLLRSTPAVAVSVDDQQLVVDLRWIAASDDRLVAGLLESQ